MSSDYSQQYIVEHVGLDVFGTLFRVFVGPFATKEDAAKEAGDDATAVISYLNAPRTEPVG